MEGANKVVGGVSNNELNNFELTEAQRKDLGVFQVKDGMQSNITSEELRLPHITLIQAMSPSAQDGTFRPGMLVNSLTQEEINTPVVFTPCYMFKNVVKFAPRESGGGIIYKTTNITADVAEDLKWKGDQKPDATAFLNCVCLVEGQEDMPLVVSFAKTSYKAGQDLFTLIKLSGKDWWTFRYELTAKKTTNTRGTFYVFSIKRLKKSDEETAEKASQLCDVVSRMGVEADYADVANETVESKDGL